MRETLAVEFPSPRKFASFPPPAHWLILALLFEAGLRWCVQAAPGTLLEAAPNLAALDFEGRPDALIRYENGIIATMDVIPGGGSTYLFRETFVDGVLKDILADDNMDGIFDRKEVYDAMGRRLSDAPIPASEAARP